MTSASSMPPRDDSESDLQEREMLEKDKKPSRLSYTPSPTELPLYESLWRHADTTENGSIITLDEALEVLSLSCLAEPKLKIILNMISKGKIFILNKQQFFVAVRLVQFTQNQQAVQNLTLTVPEEIDLDPPYFKGLSGSAKESNSEDGSIHLEEDTEMKSEHFSKGDSSRSLNDSTGSLNNSNTSSSRSNGLTFTVANEGKTNDVYENNENTTCICPNLSYRCVMLEKEVERMRQMLESTIYQVNSLTEELSIVKRTYGVDVIKDTNYHPHSLDHNRGNSNRRFLSDRSLTEESKAPPNSSEEQFRTSKSMSPVKFKDQLDREGQTQPHNSTVRGVLKRISSQPLMAPKEPAENYKRNSGGDNPQGESFRTGRFPFIRMLSDQQLKKKKESVFVDDDVSSISDHEYREEEKKDDRSLGLPLLRTISFMRRKKAAQTQVAHDDIYNQQMALNVNPNPTEHFEPSRRSSFEERRCEAFTQQMEKSLTAMNGSQHSFRSSGPQKFVRY